jgi:RHS repeat-associated protein
MFLLALTFAAAGVRAQVGNDNPTGPAGIFNGNVTTACSYDPYTGNAKRSVTDLVVAGSVGSYPLAFTRTANSRNQLPLNYQFGEPGLWHHSYEWTMDGINFTRDPNYQPVQYTVYFPDGRYEVFSPSSSDSCFRSGPGVRDRFQPLDRSTMLAYLIFPDGGKVEFTATQTMHWSNVIYYSISYRATAIIDPHSLRTTLAYNSDGTLATIQEPAGRWIQLTYITVPWTRWYGFDHDRIIDHVQASDGRTVQYNYADLSHGSGTRNYTHLISVVYPADPGASAPIASYTYQSSNYNDPYGGEAYPLLRTCDDPMYDGPMKRIGYVYATANDDGSSIVAGQIRSENYFDGVNIGAAVSTLTINSPTDRTETRGDGPSRTFNYNDGKLANYTDFQGHTSSISYDGNGYVWSFTDARLHTTTTLREGIIGAVSVLTHPDPEQSTQRFAYKYADDAPYFIQIRGDERNSNSNTYFLRPDSTNRVTKIWYPDSPNGPTEEFNYTGFGQIETHTMTSGGVENFRYDGRGLKYLSWPPPTPSDPNPEQHPTRYFYYTSGPQTDRLRQVVDPRGYSASFEYNVRGNVTKVTHDQDQTSAQFGYNLDGTLAWTADENHPNASWNPNERTRFTYDDFKRVTSVTNPMNEITNFSYAPPNGTGSYAHTTGSVYRVTSQLNKITTFDYDENCRRKMVRQGAESIDDDGGTWFDYDEVGNLKSIQDPRGKVTTFTYDERNRPTSMTDPVPTDFNGNGNRNAKGHTVDWEHDTRSNLTKETRADDLYRRMEYDAQSRVIDTYGFANEHTHYERDLAGNVKQLTDPKPATYFLDYDKMNRKIGATYPMDATQTVRGESWHYDFAGNMDQYTNPAGQIKTLGYDTRNRLYSSSWNAGGGPSVGLGYYNNSQLGIVVTYVGGNPETTVSFGYDDANRQTWEEQTVAGYPTRRIETPRNGDGLRASLVTPAYALSYDYTTRGQLRTISFNTGTPWFSYSYDLAGNMMKRQDVSDGVNDSTNVMDAAGVSQYDGLNRPTMWEQTATVHGTRNTAFAQSHFAYDSLSRLTGSWRDEQGNLGESFAYSVTGQLAEVRYNADEVWNPGGGLHATRRVTYAMSPDTLNRTSMTDNGELNIYTPNALNQYSDVNGGAVYYDGNFNLMWTAGFSAGYDADKSLTAIASGEDYGQFVYDGLGRCLKRTIDWETTLINYDGWKPIVEWDEWNNLKAWNLYGSGPDEILYRHDASRGDLRYHLDRMGNVSFLLDSDGDGIERYTYDAFGAPSVTDWDGNNPRSYSWYGNRFMFTGREYFPEFGLYDYRNRFYYPTIGRFLQTDPIGFDAGDMNLFRYCGSDPINGSDPLGLQDQGGGNDHAHDRDWNDREVWGYTDSVNVNGYDLSLADEHRERWSTFTPLNDYFKSLFNDDKSRMNPATNATTDSSNLFHFGSQVLAVGGGLQTFGEATLSGSVIGSNGKIYANVFHGNQYVKVLKLGGPLRAAAIGGFGLGVALDTYGVLTGTQSVGKLSANTAISAYGLTGPMQAATAAMYFGIEAFYPGGLLGEGERIPYKSAGAWSDYGTTINENRKIVPNWQPKEPGD